MKIIFNYYNINKEDIFLLFLLENILLIIEKKKKKEGFVFSKMMN